MKITIHKIPFERGEVNALAFVPTDSSKKSKNIAIFAHGFTSHKGSLLNWATRLATEGLPCLIFDLPGHYIGSFCEVSSFEAFQTKAPELFVKAKEILEELTGQSAQKTIIGGHSLGSLISLMAMENKLFDVETTQLLCVGLGLPEKGTVHLFKTPFYKSTLNIRGQLVSPSLDPDIVFPWIKEKKTKLNLNNVKVHFITGQDDIVATKGGTQRLIDLLKDKNTITFDQPSKLAHHMPELAAGLIKRYLTDEKII